MVLKDTSIWGSSSTNNPVVPQPKPPQPQPATGGAGTHTAYETDAYGNRIEVTYDATGKVIGSKRMNRNPDGSYVTPGPFSGFGFKFSSYPTENVKTTTPQVSSASQEQPTSNTVVPTNSATDRWKSDQAINEKFGKHTDVISQVAGPIDLAGFTNWLKKRYSYISDDDFNPYYLKELYDGYKKSTSGNSNWNNLTNGMRSKFGISL